jgi:hypothetical protein
VGLNLILEFKLLDLVIIGVDSLLFWLVILPLLLALFLDLVFLAIDSIFILLRSLLRSLFILLFI